MTDTIQAVDVTDEIPAPKTLERPARYYAHGREKRIGRIWWACCMEGHDSALAAIECKGMSASEYHSIRVYRIGGEPAKVSIDWERAWMEVDGLCDEGDLSKFGMATVQHCVESQLKERK